jgi:molecular chaperone DnaJ
MSAKRDYYEVLGISKGASAEEIRKAFHGLAKKLHPDRNVGDDEAAARFKEANEANEVLSDPHKREIYDRYGHAGLSGIASGMSPNFEDGVGDPISDFLNNVSSLFGGGGRRGPQRGRDIHARIEIDLLEAYRGASRSISFQRHEACPDCSGSGARRGTSRAECKDCRGRGEVISRRGIFTMQQTCPGCGGFGYVIPNPCGACHGNGRVAAKRTLNITIPEGAPDGLQMQVPGEGEAGQPGARRGDLIYEVRVRPHPLFIRDEDNLVCQVPITFSQAALGAEIEVPTLDGPLSKTIKPGTQSGDVIRIPGKGMPSLRTNRRGQMHVAGHGELRVVLLVDTPRNLTKRQQELFRELAEIDKKHVSPERKSFFDKLRDLFTPTDKDKKEAQA